MGNEPYVATIEIDAEFIGVGWSPQMTDQGIPLIGIFFKDPDYEDAFLASGTKAAIAATIDAQTDHVQAETKLRNCVCTQYSGPLEPKRAAEELIRDIKVALLKRGQRIMYSPIRDGLALNSNPSMAHGEQSYNR